MLKAYNQLLTRRPVLTKAATSFVLFGAGDAIAQKLTKPDDALDVRRTLIMSGWGAVGFTPLAHGWYNLLERLVPASATSSAAVTVVKKVLLDQLAWTPVINSLFFFALPVISNGDPAAGLRSVSEKLWPTLKVNWVVWPAIQLVNLAFVPLQHRILVINLASLGWSSYLASVAHSGEANKPQEGKQEQQ